MTHAESLLWEAVTPAPGEAHIIYEHAIGGVIKDMTCSEEIRSLLAREVIEQETFPIENETGVHTLRVPTVKEFLDNTAMHCIEVIPGDHIDVAMETYFEEASKRPRKKVVEIVIEGDAKKFIIEPFM